MGSSKQFASATLTRFAFAMSKARSFMLYWMPVLLWMSLIFSASSDSFSFQHSSRIIAPILRWLMPNISEESVHFIVVVVRKASHVTEFAILAVLVLRCIRRHESRLTYPWDWSHAGLTLLTVVLYAASDEFHQRFVPSREASLRDVAIDSAGSVFSLLLLWVLGRFRQRR